MEFAKQLADNEHCVHGIFTGEVQSAGSEEQHSGILGQFSVIHNKY